MSDLPDNGLGPIVNLRIKLTAAQKEIEHYENAMREIQAATSDKVVLAITDEALCDE